MLAAGVPVPRSDHAYLCAEMAFGMLENLANLNRENQSALGLRVGIANCPAVAEVIAYIKYSYDLLGNTANTASRMESTSSPGRVQLAPATYASLEDRFDMAAAGTVWCKGLGEIATYFLLQSRAARD